jgi:uncharacterized protein (DUF2267 family)
MDSEWDAQACATMISGRDDDVDAIDTTVHKTYHWIDELARDLGGVGRKEAYRDLRAFLQTVRDRLIVDEAANLAAQLPMLIRGLYYEGWDPSKTPVKMDRMAFMLAFMSRALLSPDCDPEATLRAAARVVRRHITEGEVEKFLQLLPTDVRRLLDIAA